ncbi:hypothetical protein D3C87_824440 [compost metagenome]|uniref:hypothetical protein n=1 Tax=Variovorax TaxID=34072 RepID=UPI000A651E29|nr:hypothetical protein [Variovorax boronicumulans]PBI96096.1 hypothetical protein BKP43_04040 [Variovorax boronicumulans]GER12381.1 hypothetical protein VHAB30_35610 [Variovorax boronicumulans]GER20174.1 hypothetical protein VCH24_52110 [Variovorax boronicumulans]
MPRPSLHSASITLKLPFDMSAAQEVEALRAAGIPVDDLGNAISGFLFVRFSNGWRSDSNIFRWFPAPIERSANEARLHATQPRRSLLLHAKG